MQEPPKNKPMVVKEVKSIVNIGGAEVRRSYCMYYMHARTFFAEQVVQ